MKLSISIIALMLAVTSTLRAQQVDTRWAPFIGCWDLVDGAANVCVAPGAPFAVTLTTRVEGQLTLEQTIMADGAPHELNEPGCTASQRAEWSRDGLKLFSKADVMCANQPARTITGLSLMTSDRSWLDVQAFDIAGRTSVRVRKYQRATGDRLDPDSAAPDLGAMFTVDDVKEANGRVSPAVLEAALAETGARFVLQARDLVALDDAGVPADVIDLMIAMSYPDKFQVERRTDPPVAVYPPMLASEWIGYWGLGYPYFYSSPGYYVNRYYYSPFAYGSSGYYYPQSDGSGGSAADSADAPSGEGRVINGVGYTRVRPREAAPRTDGDDSRAGGSSGRRASMTPSGATQSSDSGSSSTSPASSGSGNSTSSSGSSESGRTAQPR